MISIEEIRAALMAHCIVTLDTIKILPRGHVRIGTNLVYPDGSRVDLFVEMGNLARTSGYAVSDFGQTLAKLAEFQMNFRSPNSRPQAIAKMARPFEVQLMGDRLVVLLNTPNELGDGLIRLGQACISVSSLISPGRPTRETP